MFMDILLFLLFLVEFVFQSSEVLIDVVIVVKVS